MSQVGRQPDRDKLLLTMLFRHGLRLSEAIDLRWSDFDLEARQRTLFVRRLKGSKNSVHTLEPDTVRMLKRAQQKSDLRQSICLRQCVRPRPLWR